MVLLNRFCFWFSSRLGSLVVGIVTLVQCSIWFMVSIISLDNLDVVREALQTFLVNLKLENTFLNHLATDPRIYLIVLNVGILILSIGTIIMIVGVFKCKYKLLIPFLVMDMIYIITMTLQHIFLMINYKKRETGSLGTLILYSNAGGFALLYLLYMWFCVLSFLRMLKECENDLSKKFLRKNLGKQVLVAVRVNNGERF